MNQKRALAVLLLLPLLLVPTGCGSDSSGSSNSSGSTDLKITVQPKGRAASSTTYTLKCPQGTGTLPDARAACSKLKQVSAKTFEPVPTGTACTEIYGGPQIARATGRLAGQSIRADFNRTNGCEIARWSRLAFLFPLSS